MSTLSALKELTNTAATVDNKLHAGFKVSQLSAERSQLYNAINTAKAAIYDAERQPAATSKERETLEQIRTWIDDLNSGVDPGMSADEVIKLIQGEVNKTLDN